MRARDRFPHVLTTHNDIIMAEVEGDDLEGGELDSGIHGGGNAGYSE